MPLNNKWDGWKAIFDSLKKANEKKKVWMRIQSWNDGEEKGSGW